MKYLLPTFAVQLTMGSVLGEEVEEVEAEEEDRKEDLPPVLHTAWEAPRLRALISEISENKFRNFSRDAAFL